jgi:hypothetical protein
MGVLAAGLAGQLVLAAAAKTRSRRDGAQTLLGTLWPRVPVTVFVAGDIVVAALLLWPRTTKLGAALAVAAIAVTEILAIAYRDRGAMPCGCFGSAPQRSRAAWRERATKAVLVVEASAVAYGAGVPASAQFAAALLLTVTVIALTPELGGGWRQLQPITAREALRALAASPDYHRWRPLLLNSQPAEVRYMGRAVRIVLDAWSGERPVVIVATVTRYRVRLRAHDADTMQSLA